MDVLALDPELSATAYKVAGVIGFHFNRHDGHTYVKQETIARIMEVSERTVWSAIVELERRGYLIVGRRDLGTTTRRERTGRSTAVRNAGGKGVANTYAPAFQRSQVNCDQYRPQARRILRPIRPPKVAKSRAKGRSRLRAYP